MTRVRRLAAVSIVFAAMFQESAVRCQDATEVQPGPGPQATAPASATTAPGMCDGQVCYPGAYGAGPNASLCNKHPLFYCPARYWTPTLARVYDCLCGPKLPVYAWNRYPDIPPTFLIQKSPCVTVDPWSTIIERPLAPETSQARYILGPR